MAVSRKPDQSAPLPVSPTGAVVHDEIDSSDERAQQGEYLTIAQGVRLPDTNHSLKAGSRGPTLLEDSHLREKIAHLDHERIPEPGPGSSGHEDPPTPCRTPDRRCGQIIHRLTDGGCRHASGVRPRADGEGGSAVEAKP